MTIPARQRIIHCRNVKIWETWEACLEKKLHTGGTLSGRPIGDGTRKRDKHCGFLDVTLSSTSGEGGKARLGRKSLQREGRRLSKRQRISLGRSSKQVRRPLREGRNREGTGCSPGRKKNKGEGGISLPKRDMGENGGEETESQFSLAFPCYSSDRGKVSTPPWDVSQGKEGRK